MAKAVDISLEGLNQLNKKLNKLIKVVDDREMETALMKPAKKLRSLIRGRAPQGPTGNLKKGIVAKRFRYKIKNQPAVFVSVDYRLAPHAHLVEFGTQGQRMPSKKTIKKKGVLGLLGVKEKAKVFKFEIGGKTIFAKSVAAMPAKPFFRNTIDENKLAIGRNIKRQAWKTIKKAIK